MNQPYPYVAPMGPTSKTNALSIISLITGILGVLFTCPAVVFPYIMFCSGPVSLGALITGFISLNQIKKKEDREKGRGMAIAGTILGAVIVLSTCVYTVLVLLVVFGALTLPFISNTIPTY
jgi:hypothetical protein